MKKEQGSYPPGSAMLFRLVHRSSFYDRKLRQKARQARLEAEARRRGLLRR